MDFFVNKELNGLKSDIKSKEITLEADKYAFETKLLNGMGEDMMNDLKNPPKNNWITSVKIKFARWKKIRSERKYYRKIKGDL